MDKIILEGISVNAIIGTLPHERIRRQQLLIDIELSLDLKKAASTDDLFQSVDYSEIEKRTLDIAENSSFQLLEALAGKVGEMLLSYELVRQAKVSLFKAAGSAAGRGVRIVMEFDK